MAISTRYIKPRSIIPEQIKGIQFALDLCMLGGPLREVAADAVGVTEFWGTAIFLTSEHLKHLKSAKFIIEYVWADTADGTIQLYDTTAGAVLAETTSKTGGEASTWEEVDVTGTLIAGNRICPRANITVAGAAGEVVKLRRAYLRLICKIG